MTTIRNATTEYLKELDDLAAKKLESILKCENTVYTSDNKFFISESGDDTNDGRSESSPWRTLSHLNDEQIGPGSVVHLLR